MKSKFIIACCQGSVCKGQLIGLSTRIHDVAKLSPESISLAEPNATCPTKPKEAEPRQVYALFPFFDDPFDGPASELLDFTTRRKFGSIINVSSICLS